MEAYFTTKEVCKIFNVGRETLRHYENIGLLHPSINPENGYRTYEYWDMGAMIDILKYRSIGLSLKETKEAMFNMDYHEIVNSVSAQQLIYQEQLKHYTMLAKKITMDLQYLRCVDENLGKMSEMELDEFCYVACRNPPPTVEYEHMLQKVFQNCQFFSSTWIFGKDSNANDYINGVGFLTETEFADFLGIEGGKKLPPTHAVGTIMEIKGYKKVSPELFEEFNAKVKEKYPSASNETYEVLLSRFRGKDEDFHQYFFVHKRL